MMKKNIFLLLIACAFFHSCNRNRLKVNISDIEKEGEVVRFDESLFSLPLKDTLSELASVRDEYIDFFDLFTWKVINAGGIEEPDFPQTISSFLSDQMVLKAKLSADSVFKDFENTEHELVK